MWNTLAEPSRWITGQEKYWFKEVDKYGFWPLTGVSQHTGYLSKYTAELAGIVEYTDCISAEG